MCIGRRRRKNVKRLGMKLCDTRFRFSARGWAMIDFTSDAAAILTRAPLLPKVRRRSHGSAYLRRLRRGHLPEVRHAAGSGGRTGHGIVRPQLELIYV